jgi:hypothetical protein
MHGLPHGACFRFDGIEAALHLIRALLNGVESLCDRLLIPDGRFSEALGLGANHCWHRLDLEQRLIEEPVDFR